MVLPEAGFDVRLRLSISDLSCCIASKRLLRFFRLLNSTTSSKGPPHKNSCAMRTKLKSNRSRESSDCRQRRGSWATVGYAGATTARRSNPSIGGESDSLSPLMTRTAVSNSWHILVTPDSQRDASDTSNEPANSGVTSVPAISRVPLGEFSASVPPGEPSVPWVDSFCIIQDEIMT